MTPPTPRAPLLAAPIDERPDALDDLAILLRPDHWLGHVGQVKKGFNPDIRCRLLPQLTKGLVFVVCEDGERDVFVHASIVERGGLRGLEEGQRLAMKVVRTQKGREAISLPLI